MAFPGIPDPQLRANVIAWLRLQSPNPVPLPEVKEGDASSGGLPPVSARQRRSEGGRGLRQDDLPDLPHRRRRRPAIVGPNLYNVVGGPHAHMAGYAYSAGMKEKTGPWTYEELNKWLYKPAAYVPGTKMAFPGIPDPQLRANVIAWLRSLSPDPAAAAVRK